VVSSICRARELRSDRDAGTPAPGPTESRAPNPESSSDTTSSERCRGRRRLVVRAHHRHYRFLLMSPALRSRLRVCIRRRLPDAGVMPCLHSRLFGGQLLSLPALLHLVPPRLRRSDLAFTALEGKKHRGHISTYPHSPRGSHWVNEQRPACEYTARV